VTQDEGIEKKIIVHPSIGQQAEKYIDDEKEAK
jgi:hypothetical protein